MGLLRIYLDSIVAQFRDNVNTVLKKFSKKVKNHRGRQKIRPRWFWSLYINIKRQVDLVRDVFAVFLSLPDTFGQKILDLSVDRTEIILRPGGNGGVELC